ncbi:MAG: ISL3 family transposase [Euryarchaeota archaeon]|nr:ISL3 family transposase [Euryarchaeota archaeon]
MFRNIYTFLGYVLSGVIDYGDHIVVSLRKTHKTTRCPTCGRRIRVSKESYPRIIRDLDIGPKQAYLSYHEYKLDCPCGYRGYERLDFVEQYSRATIRFEEYVYRLCLNLPLKSVCEIAGIDWKAAKNIDIRYTQKRIEDLRNISPKRIGIDEIAYEKGHHYLSVVRDIDLGKVIWVGLDRKSATLDMFFNELGPEKSALIEIVVMDMWDPYILSVRINCPNVEIVFDKFHVIRKITDALDKVRKTEFADADDDERKLMKHKRFLMLKRRERLDHEELETLDKLMKKNETLYIAYLLKEQVSDIFDRENVHSALIRLGLWFRNVRTSALEPFINVMETIRRYYYGIANYFRHQLTNAGSEGFNTKINIIKRRAYGFADLDYFKLKIFQACGILKSAQSPC